MASLESWHDFGYVSALQDDYRLILLDAREHGDSDKPHSPEAYELKTRVADITVVLDDLGIAQAHFLGYSMAAGSASARRATRPSVSNR
jgi:pimeloyl-ACP methyl ester carboxylesterase